MHKCAACGSETKTGISLGGIILCRSCDPEVREEMDRLRAEGKPVNVGHIARRIYREKYCVGDYILRDIPADLWTRAKHRAVDDGTNLREMVLKALKAYLS